MTAVFKKKWPGWLVGACGTCWAASALANAPDLTAFSLEQLAGMEVRSASRYTQAAIDAPATVSTITAEEIRTFGYHTLGEALQSMRGLQVTNDRNYDRIGARGFATPGDYSTRLLLLVDGMRYNDVLYDQASIGHDFNIDMALVERIEYVAGPGSSVYGPNAFFGVVNVITRRPDVDAGQSVALMAGSAGQLGASAILSGATDGGAGWLLAATREVRSGRDLYFAEFDAPGIGDGWARDLDFERYTNVFARLVYGPWTWTATHGDRVKGMPTASFEQAFNTAPSFTRDERNSLSVEYRDLIGGATNMSARLDLGYFRYDGDYIYDYPPLTVDRDNTSARWLDGEWQVVHPLTPAQTLVAGIDYRRDLRVTQRNYDVQPHFDYLDVRSSGTVWGVYAQDDLRWNDVLSISAGVRYNHHSTTGGTTNPRLAAIWKFRDDTALKALYGTAYRPPNYYEADYVLDSIGGAKHGPTLRPETIRSTELALEHAPGHGQRLLVSAFRNVVDDLIVNVLDENDGLTYFTNLSNALARGLEVEGEYAWQSGVQMRASATVQRVTDRSTGMLVPNSPRRLAKLKLSAPLTLINGRVGVEALAMGPRVSLAGMAPGFVVVNANLVADRVLPWLDVALKVSNLFDVAWFDPGGPEHMQDLLQRDGREWRLTASVAF